jgi:RNA polymerase sigma-70 factor (ECF subfamily)
VTTFTRGFPPCPNPELIVNAHQLVQEIRAGHAAAERQLYEAHVDRVYRLAYRLTGDDALAEDLTQDIFIRAFDRLDDFRGDGPFAGWLHRIATSVIFSALRKRKRVREHESLRDDLAELENQGRTATHTPASDPDLRRHLDRAVASLDDTHRLVFVMHDLEGFTHQEIAAAMDSPVGTAKARLSRARSRLRELLVSPRGPQLDLEME